MVMPEISQTTAEVKLIAWLKKPGDPVKRGEPVLEVETDKATVEVEAYVDGFLRLAKYPAGATVPVDAVIAILTTTPDETIDGLDEVPATAAARADESVTIPEPSHKARTTVPGRVDISPVARKLAEDNGIDLASLHGTGPQGRITRADVEAKLLAQAGAAADGRGGRPAPAHVPTVSSMRNAIAQRTALSKASIPHYYVSVEIDMQAAQSHLARLEEEAASGRQDIPTLTDVVVWACGQVLRNYPSLHGTWSDGGPRILPQINIGIVVGLDEGLIVPVLHDADGMSLSVLSAATRALKHKAKQGGLSARELTGGTFTVSNLGMFGVSSFIAVINPPESAILALGGILKRAVVDANDQVVVRPLMTATLSVDHRMVDGIAAAGFLKSLKGLLEAPASLSPGVA